MLVMEPQFCSVYVQQHSQEMILEGPGSTDKAVDWISQDVPN